MVTDWEGILDHACQAAGYFSQTQCRHPKHTLFLSISFNIASCRPYVPVFKFGLSTLPAGAIYACASAIRVDGKTYFNSNSVQGELVKTLIQVEYRNSLD